MAKQDMIDVINKNPTVWGIIFSVMLGGIGVFLLKSGTERGLLLFGGFLSGFSVVAIIIFAIKGAKKLEPSRRHRKTRV